MSRIFVSGLVNLETNLRVRQFPLEYYPIDYPFFGVSSAPAGVGLNITRALRTLRDEVTLNSMTGQDFPAQFIRQELDSCGVATDHILPILRETPASVVLYDETGRRQVHSDLKDIQQAACPFDQEAIAAADLVVACNINFNRPLLALAKAAGKPIATDVHVLRDVHDDYNRDFMQAADILFLSDEGAGEGWEGFLWELSRTYPCRIIVMGRGAQGAAMYLREENQIRFMPSFHVGEVVNTVGAGDSLFSAFLHYYAQGMPPMECLLRAQIFASAKIGVSGAGRGFIPPERVEELCEALRQDAGL